jgi:glyoxylase-like metal-dependent hydrolase (beta-lactamase superfamily II)
MPPLWEIYAIRYATHPRMARENFIGGDPHENATMPLDYFIWVIQSSNAQSGEGPAAKRYVIDTGFGEAQAKLRSRTLLKPPADGLGALGIDPAQVRDVLMTHLHYDHCGNYDLFPNARYHVQEREMQYCTGRLITHDYFRHAFDEEGVVAMVRKLYAGRINFLNGDEEIDDGISAHLIGGHSQGLQCIRVQTRRGPVVLASDAAHLYEHLRRNLAFTVTCSIADTLDGYAKLRKLTGVCSNNDDEVESRIIPGHDPEVLRRYPAAAPGLENWIARLD